MIAAWSQAVACFGAETVRTLVVELSKTGLPAQQLQRPLGSSAPATQSPSGTEGTAVPSAEPSLPSVSASSSSSCAIILEGASAALRSAAEGTEWGSEVPATLAMMGWVFAETRQWLQSQSGSDSTRDTQPPQQQFWQTSYSVNLHSFAAREQLAAAPLPSATPSPSSALASHTATGFSWGGAGGWMAELTAIAAQKRRGGHVELSEERQRRIDAVISALKQRLAPVEKDVGGLLQLGPAQGVLLSMPLQPPAPEGGAPHLPSPHTAAFLPFFNPP